MYTPRDWLATQNEVGQTPKKYKLGGPNIRWMHAKQKKIVLFAIDGTIDDETLELYRGYYWLISGVPGFKLSSPGPRS